MRGLLLLLLLLLLLPLHVFLCALTLHRNMSIPACWHSR